jgi:serine protease AprX
VTLMLEANPDLGWREVKQILQDTATNMPGRAPWEVGSGYVNAHAAVKAALAMSDRFGDHDKTAIDFNAGANLGIPSSEDYPISFTPVGDTEVKEFVVAENISMIMATGTVELGTAFVLEDPMGKRYSSGIGLIQVQGTNRAISATGMPGIWKLYMGGIGSISGQSVDPLGVTNGVAGPESTTVTVKQFAIGSYFGINDAIGHPAESFIKFAVASHLMDGTEEGFQPDKTVTKAELANMMMFYGAVRQSNDGNTVNFVDSNYDTAAAMNSVVTNGASIKDRAYANQGVMQSDSSDMFGATKPVTREILAYTLVQMLGQQGDAAEVDQDQPLKVFIFDQWVEVVDSDMIAPELLGHVQLALNAGLLQAAFSFEDDPIGMGQVLKARFNPNTQVNRALMAMSLTQLTPLMAE